MSACSTANWDQHSNLGEAGNGRRREKHASPNRSNRYCPSCTNGIPENCAIQTSSEAYDRLLDSNLLSLQGRVMRRPVGGVLNAEDRIPLTNTSARTTPGRENPSATRVLRRSVQDENITAGRGDRHRLKLRAEFSGGDQKRRVSSLNQASSR